MELDFDNENNIDFDTSFNSSGYSRELESDRIEEIGENESGGSIENFDSSVFSNIDTNVDSLVLQVDNLNENVNVLNENLKFGICLLFVIVFSLMIRFAYHILGTILGLNKS